MNIIRQFATLFFAVSCAGIMTPVFAQATVLTGQVASLAAPGSLGHTPILQGAGQYDGNHYAGTNYINTNAASKDIGFQRNENFYAVPAARKYQNPPLSANARNYHVQRPIVRTVYVRDDRTFFQRHPKVKAASIGAGVGAGAGALTGLVTGRGVVRGALIGGGTGAGVGLVRSSVIMKHHPIARDVATGGLVGLGLGASGSRYGRTTMETTGIGAAVGLGVGMFKHFR